MSLNTQEQSQANALVAQRFEIKYKLPETIAQGIIDYISPHMKADPQGLEYPVTSLYLDSPAMHMFWSSRMGEMNRYKLRLRSYSDDESSMMFAEVKQRLNRVIRKARVAVRKDSITDLLSGSGDSASMLIKENESTLNDLNYFRSLMGEFQARPSTTVRYMREAYVGRMGESVRITFDRNLGCLPSTEYSHDLWNAQAFWHELHHIPVIMEVKFTDTYPQWVHSMIQRFSLARTSMAKYVECVKVLHHEGLQVVPKLKGAQL